MQIILLTGKPSIMILTKLKANLCLFNQARNNQARIKMRSHREIPSLRIVSLSPARKAIAKLVIRNTIWLDHRMSEHQFQRRFQHQIKTKQFNLVKQARNLTTALPNLHLPQKQDILLRIQIKLIKIPS